MPPYSWVSQHKVYVKVCHRCKIEYMGASTEDETLKLLSKFFSTDKYTTDGFYGSCRPCVSKVQRGRRDGRVCDPEALLKGQEGKCGICRKDVSFVRGNGAKVLAYMDHNHESNTNRGILCPRCNSLLRGIEDIEWRESAIAYLNKWNCE